MKQLDIKPLAKELKTHKLKNEIHIMEVCGTHTTQFFKTGVRDLFPEDLKLIDGPGCPVCVTPNHYLDRAIEIAKHHNTIIATFGDMVKVPSSYSSLLQEQGNGISVEIVYSPMDALSLAKNNPDREVVFLSVGFETTAPTEAATVIEAKKHNIQNFSILAGNKLTPPAVKALLDSGEVNIDGFILPGHVSAVVGVQAWRFIADEYHRPTVISGFEAPDLVVGTMTQLAQIQNKQINTVNMYPGIVTEQGNTKALEIIHEVFEPCDTEWRGIGIIPGSGLQLNTNYKKFNAQIKFPVDLPEIKEHKGCRCGELLRGLIVPTDCPLFGNKCTPENAVGPCMVSSEGPCAAYYKYGRQ